tara:strand:- start:207 stop:914 length:708 start_codon:yes stop_codon:yes gene_type:complete
MSMDWKKMYQICLAEKKVLKEENASLKNVTGQMFVATDQTVVQKYREQVKELKAEMTELKDQMTYLEDDNCRYANALEEEYILKTDVEEEYVLKTTCDPNIPWFKSDYEELKDQLDIAEADLEEQANIVCEVKEENKKLKKKIEELEDRVENTALERDGALDDLDKLKEEIKEDSSSDEEENPDCCVCCDKNFDMYYIMNKDWDPKSIALRKKYEEYMGSPDDDGDLCPECMDKK